MQKENFAVYTTGVRGLKKHRFFNSIPLFTKFFSEFKKYTNLTAICSFNITLTVSWEISAFLIFKE